VKSWRRRYFSLAPDKLQISYYKSAGAQLEKRKPKGVIHLEGACARRTKDKPCMLEVYYPKQPHRRIFRIVASSEHAADSWVKSINEIIKMSEDFGDEMAMSGELEDNEKSDDEQE